MSVFDDIERTDMEPAGHLVSRFDYLNASARPEAQRVRDTVDAFFAKYPATHADEMRNRLRSRDETLHQSALFELALHELLLRQGFTVVEVEPTLANGRSPDFLVASPAGDRFYLEATLASGQPAATAGAERRMREALQAIDEVESPNFFLGLHPRGTPSQPVATARLKRAVQRFIDGLDYDAVVADHAAGRPLPMFESEAHGAVFRIEAIPKNLRRAGGRAVAVRMMPALMVQPQEAIKDAVLGKAGRYGDPDLPYIIAVNALEQYAEADDAEDALFGTTAVVVRPGRPDQRTRARDGVWLGRNGPTHTRVSGVLSTERLSAWALGQRRARLLVNPWARRPLPDLPLGVDVVRVFDHQLHHEAGSSWREILGLPEDWP